MSRQSRKQKLSRCKSNYYDQSFAVNAHVLRKSGNTIRIYPNSSFPASELIEVKNVRISPFSDVYDRKAEGYAGCIIYKHGIQTSGGAGSFEDLDILEGDIVLKATFRPTGDGHPDSIVLKNEIDNQDIYSFCAGMGLEGQVHGSGFCAAYVRALQQNREFNNCKLTKKDVPKCPDDTIIEGFALVRVNDSLELRFNSSAFNSRTKEYHDTSREMNAITKDLIKVAVRKWKRMKNRSKFQRFTVSVRQPNNIVDLLPIE